MLPDDHSARPADEQQSVVVRRLSDLRWVLLAAAAVLFAAAAIFGMPLLFAIAGFICILGAAIILPRWTEPVDGYGPGKAIEEVRPNDSIKKVVESLPDAGFVVDQRGNILFANGHAQRLFGPIRLGSPFSFCLRVPALLEVLERVVDGGEAERVRWSEKVPTERWFEAQIAPSAAADPDAEIDADLPFILIVIRDLTEQYRSARMRADFVANASHELRTPLASLRGFIETLQGPAKHDEQARERFLAIMNDQAARMSRLIDDLLSLSRIEMRVHVLPETVIDLRAVLSHVADALEPLGKEHGVGLESQLPDVALNIRGDNDELVQMFENLVQNAIKYGSDGQRVRISGELIDEPGKKNRVAVEIRDWGPGIPEEHLPRLTERFYRIDVATSREKQGTGLGLAIVKHILNRHRAVLSIENAEDTGAVFTVIFDSA